MHLEENKLGRSNSIIVSTGITFVKCLTSLLWHITCHHDNFVKRGINIPVVFRQYQNYNDYYAKRKSKPQLTREKMMKFVETLSGFIVQDISLISGETLAR